MTRTAASAVESLSRLAEQAEGIAQTHRVQITSDAHRPYLEAIEGLRLGRVSAGAV